MLVKSRPGTRTPIEGNPKKYITDTEPVEVDPTGYYKRLIEDGSLVDASAAPAKGGKE